MTRAVGCLAVLALAMGCAGATPAAHAPGEDAARLSGALTKAFAEEATGDAATAERMYLDLIDQAASGGPDAWQVGVTAAALDALVFRSISALDGVTPHTALLYRTLDPSLRRGETLAAEERGKDSIAARLSHTYEHASGPFVRGMIARAMVAIAVHRGDADDAARWREASGYAREATIVGPLDWATITAVTGDDPLAKHDARLAPSYRAPGAFAPELPPFVERGHGTTLDLSTYTGNPGVRDVVVDVTVPRAQRIGVALRSTATATLRAGGKVVLTRPYELGGAPVTELAIISVAPGTLRLVARVGMDQDGDTVEIGAWDDTGKPLPLRAPRAGEAGNVAVKDAQPIGYPVAHSPDERLVASLAALAAGDGRSAEYMLEAEATRPDCRPDLALVYGRAVETARDLSLVHRSERARTGYERALAVWPSAWEAIAAHASLAGVKRGPGDARFAELDDLDALRARANTASLPVLDAFDAATSGQEQLYDRADRAMTRLKKALGDSALFEAVTRAAVPRSKADQVAFDCALGSSHDRGSLACYEALRRKGDLGGGLKELERLRGLLGGVDLFLPLTLRDSLALGDRAVIDRALHDMLPSDVTLAALYGLASLDPNRAVPAPETRDQIFGHIATAGDSPRAVGPILRALHDDPTAPFAGVAEALSREDRLHPILPGTGTTVLRHYERYDIEPTGSVHAFVFDVRRVSSTTDVEENAQAAFPGLTGRAAYRILRRRILKRDGTVVEPDPNPGAQQGHADLAQLEAGDLVEAIYDAWAIPLETGEIGIDTPDLLPERTAVHDAVIEIREPSSLSSSLWSHPMLGPPTTKVEGKQTTLRWTLKDHLARRVEDGTPKMDRNVAVSFSTARWDDVARGLRETVAGLDDHDPAVGDWARGVVASAKAQTDRAKIDAVVLASGTAVKEGSTGELSDLLFGHATGPQSNDARAVLNDHEGTRTWLIVRALRELGVASEVVVAENEPFSATALFPPHSGRFLHPLAVAHPKGEPQVWIDADVPGPPLPAGHISPELRGRQALHEDGSISALPETSRDDERDEVDERLVVDAQGDAKGTFTIMLRGRDAQEIAEALERVVGDERQRALRGVVLSWVPFANVDSVNLSSSEGSWQIALRAAVAIPGYALAEGHGSFTVPGVEPVHEVYPRGSSSTLSAVYATEGKRESALAISRAVQYHLHRRIELPADAQVTRVPGPFEVKTKELGASRRLRVVADKGVAIEDDLALEIPTGTVPASGYEKFVTEAHRADDAFLASARVRLNR